MIKELRGIRGGVMQEVMVDQRAAAAAAKRGICNHWGKGEGSRHT